MSTPRLVDAFYARIWNIGDLTAIPELIAPDFRFRGSLGNELRGHAAFEQYVRSVRTPLANYRCDILDCVAEGNRAFAQMRFSGQHVGPFRNFAPTGKPVHWMGAALFTFDQDRITELWVLGDLLSLDALLKSQAAPTR